MQLPAARRVREPGPAVKATPLRRAHAALGATLVDFAGWEMPLRYDSETKEHLAVRSAAGIFDLSHMGEIEVFGPQAGDLLDYALVSRPSAIAPGRARYSMICDDAGRILDDLVVYRLQPEHFLVVANASNAQTVLAELTARSTGFDASVQDTLDDWALIAVQGPAAAGLVESLVESSTEGLAYYAIRPDRIENVDILLARTGYTGEDGFEIYCPTGQAERIWTAAMAAGQLSRLVPAGLAARDSLRLEAGMPLYGNELSAELTPYDAGLGRVVALNKTVPFVGQDALRAASQKAPTRTLVGLRSQGRRPLRHGHEVHASDGAAVGLVTSGLVSPTLGSPIAMAYLDQAHSAEGTTLHVRVRASDESVAVVALPFYRRA